MGYEKGVLKMARILKGYKKGRSFVGYDVYDDKQNKQLDMVDKNAVARMCGEGFITNATVQWWQGKPIIRLKDESVQIVSIVTPDGETPAVVHRVKTGLTGYTGASQVNSVKQQPVQSEVVGKISKKRKNETAFDGINKKEIEEHRQLASTIKYDKMNTLGDLFEQMMVDFRLKNTDTYRKMIAKKVKLETPIRGLARQNLMAIQQAMAVYLMNMSNLETREIYTKYLPV